jgi:hypothetical protein
MLLTNGIIASMHTADAAAVQRRHGMQEIRKNHYIFLSQLRADQMPGPPREGQLMYTLFLSTCQ